MTEPQKEKFVMETRVVAMAAALLSVAAFAWYFSRGEVLLYGDAVAHTNIARRVFDSAAPGLHQLGTVWLPFPHLVTVPFIVNDWMWRTGAGGAMPAMIAYVLGVAGVFRLVRRRTSRAGGIAAAAIYGLNPNLLYMQSTAMTESIFLALIIWTVVYLDEFAAGLRGEGWGLAPHKALERCGLVLAAAILTRYDGWVLAAICGIVFGAMLASRWKALEAAERRRLLRSAAEVYLLCALVGALWLAQNYGITGNALDFANGPYSAKAIAARSTAPGQPGHPGSGNLWVSAIFFLKAAKLNVSWGAWQSWSFFALLSGTAIAVFRLKRDGVLLLLWFVLPFYAYSVAYGNVPIFLPVWWPYSYYNVRYGLELLPAFSVFTALLAGWAFGRFGAWKAKLAVALGVAVIVGGSYASVTRATPICLREARANSTSRIALETRLGEELSKLPAGSTLLMFTGSHVGALQRQGIHLKRVVNEAVHPKWEYAMSNPGGYTDYVVAVEGDPVAWAVRTFPAGLELVVQFDTAGKPRTSIYRSKQMARSGGS